MPVFRGLLKVRVCEAVDLKPTPWALRHAGGRTLPHSSWIPTSPSTWTRPTSFLLDPYLTLNLDQTHLGQTCTKNRTNSPAWNHDFTAQMTGGGHWRCQCSMMHQSDMTTVANCTIQLEDILQNSSTHYQAWRFRGTCR
uniref:C2 domain-containing protein n=1 Tax=Hucho hucho TaxID=62062 RepID=A0A4W5K1Z3_9TELE